MALNPEEKFQSTTRDAYPRAAPYEGGVRSKRYAGSGTANEVELAVLTPLGRDSVTQNLKVWNPVGANGIDEIVAFVYPDPVTILSTADAPNDEILGNVLMRGEIHRDDVPLVSGATQNQVDAALLGLRAKGIDVQGLPDVLS